MNLTCFSVNTTNIFPMTNTSTGGQLLTEYNLRAIDSVATSEEVNYYIGQSFVHGEKDFYLLTSSNALDYGNDAAIPANGIIEIQPGRAVVNGHFIESLVPIPIDMFEINEQLRSSGQDVLSGEISIGLLAVYSTETTMAGSIKPEVISASGTGEYLYEGIQVVILPSEAFKLPSDVPDDETSVTAHVKLGSFMFTSSGITNVSNNYPAKCRIFDAIRTGSADEILSDEYVKKTGLDPGSHYVYAGKGQTETKSDTWCAVDDSLIVWDAFPHKSKNKPEIESAMFGLDASETVRLYLPHKQIDGSAGYSITDEHGNILYFDPVSIAIPKADYNLGTGGTVDSKYTNVIKKLRDDVNTYRMSVGGKQVFYIDYLDSIEELPKINNNWSPGDYILVNQDNTIIYESTVIDKKPSTMYAVIPGYVQEISYVAGYYGGDGIELNAVSASFEDGADPPSTDDPEVYSQYWGDLTQYRGRKNIDYFLYEYTDENGDVHKYYYVVTVTAAKEYSDAIVLSGPIPVASEDVVGGFLNVPDTATDYGYVYRDEDGHLRLMDYALLRTGVLAYQLGEDFTTPSGASNDEVQLYLNEYVNQRVAFPNVNQIQNAEDPNVIHINVTVTDSEDAETINIYDIDSRFNTSVYLHLYGNASSNITINISDCARIRVENKITGDPNINLYRSCIYYDSNVINALTNIVDMSLWYQQFTATDPDLVVDGMEVICNASTSVYTDLNVATSDSWSTSAPNDNHFMVALKSITFKANGDVIGASVLVRNASTSNVRTGSFVIRTSFELPQGPSLYYPKRRMPNQIKITGQFIASYVLRNPSGYMIQDTRFSLLTPSYDTYEDAVIQGSIAFFITASVVEDTDPKYIDAWSTNSFHYFSGSTLMT